MASALARSKVVDSPDPGNLRVCCEPCLERVQIQTRIERIATILKDGITIAAARRENY